MSRLSVENLTVSTDSGTTLVDGIDFHLEKGEWLSLIGESGSGKSMTAFAIADLLPPAVHRTAVAIDLDGTDVLHAPPALLQQLRGAEIAYVFQDYAGAFTPYIRIGDQMVETIRAHRHLPSGHCQDMIIHALDEVGLPGAEFSSRYPFQLSGGQLQRAAIAHAMLLEPTLLIADEPTTALDAVTEAVVLDLINDMRMKHGCSVLFITHDLRCVVRHSDRVAVMRGGQIIETGATQTVVDTPAEKYTRDLFNAVPRLEAHHERLPVAAHNEPAPTPKIGGEDVTS